MKVNLILRVLIVLVAFSYSTDALAQRKKKKKKGEMEQTAPPPSKKGDIKPYSKVITKGIKSVNEILRIHKLGDRVNKERVEYSDLITRFCNNINIEPKQIDEIHLLAKNLLKKYKSELSSCTPSSLSASFIYYYIYLNKLKISKKDLSENTHISIVTIQKIVNLLNDLEIKKNEIY